jgi:aryl-alcohol dehydrogenase-like predicted oxidoreductase
MIYIHFFEMTELLKESLGASEFDASVVVLGTWVTGGDGWGDCVRSDAIAAIHAAIDSGINMIDTAPIYGFGLAEEIVGEAIADRRDSVILATKVGLRWNADVGEFNFEDGSGNRIHKCLSAESIRYELEQSLCRLGVDFIDLYQTHWPTSTSAIEDSMAELIRQQELGKIRSIGVSNISADDLEAYCNVGGVVSIQEMFSMVDRAKENNLFQKAIGKGMSVLAYSPLAMGLLSGKMGVNREFLTSDNRSWSPRFTIENRRKISAMLEEFKPIANDLGLTLAQLVISWTIARSTVTHVLCGARNAQQARENAISGRKILDDSSLSAIDSILERHALKLPHPFLPDE